MDISPRKLCWPRAPSCPCRKTPVSPFVTLTEDLSLVHAQGGEPVPLEQEEELTRTERKRFSDVLDAHVLESRAGEHGTELVIGGVKPERLERFRSILDAYKPEDQSMETIQ